MTTIKELYHAITIKMIGIATIISALLSLTIVNIIDPFWTIGSFLSVANYIHYRKRDVLPKWCLRMLPCHAILTFALAIIVKIECLSVAADAIATITTILTTIVTYKILTANLNNN